MRHRCDQTLCVSPYHLLVGTQADNVADMISRGRFKAPTLGEQHHNAVLTNEKVKAARILYQTGEFSFAAIGRIVGVHYKTISRIIIGDGWRHVA